MGAPSSVLRSWALSQHGHGSAAGRREGCERLYMHRAPHAQAKPGKNNPDPVRKEARGVGVKLHIQLGTRLLRVELGVSPGRGLLCALVSPHRAPCCFLGSSMPGAGLENQLLGQACLFSIPQGFFFPLPSLPNNSGAVLDLAMTGFQPEPPVLTLTPLELLP